jgi:hypothetical protein
MALTAERLRALVDYDKSTGVFVRRVTCGAARAGSIAGCISKHGGNRLYLRFNVDGRLYFAHRLAWLFVTGNWPKHNIDHIDGDGTNNAFSNLRDATQAENSRNRGPNRNSKSGFKGVYFHSETGKWRAIIKHNGKPVSLGLYFTPDEAHRAYCTAAATYHGQFGRTQ